MAYYNLADRGAAATPVGSPPGVNNLAAWLSLLPLLKEDDRVYCPTSPPPSGSKEDCGEYLFWSTGNNNAQIVQIPDGVEVYGDGRSTRWRCINNPTTGRSARFIGRTLRPTETGQHGGISIRRLSVRQSCTAADEQSHAIMFGSGAPDAQLVDLLVEDVRVEESLGGDGVVFSTCTSDTRCERVEVGRTVRRALSVSGHGDPGTRKNFVFRDCVTVNSPIRTNGMTFEHEDADGTFENVLLERVNLSGPAAWGRLLGAVFKKVSVAGSVVFGAPRDVQIDGLRVAFVVEPTDNGLSGSDAHRGLNLYGTGSGVQIKNTEVSVWDPLNKIPAGKAHGLVVAAGVTGVTVGEAVEIGVDLGKPAMSGVFAGTPTVHYHPPN